LVVFVVETAVALITQHLAVQVEQALVEMEQMEITLLLEMVE
jgi:hypothetical protein